MPREHEIQNRIQNLRNINDQLLRLDASLFSKKSRERFENMNTEERDLFKKELKDEIDRIGIEKQIQQIEQRLEQGFDEINQYLGFAANPLNKGKRDEALNAIEQAISLKKETSELAKRIKKLKGILQTLAKREFNLEKQMAAFMIFTSMPGVS